MIKSILLFTLFLSNAFAQNANEVTNATISPGLSATRNYVKNPSGFKNALNVTVSNATIARDTDTADKLDGIASLVCDASAQDGYCLWSLNTIQEGDKTGNCEFKLTYKGDASLYKLRITDTSSTLTDSTVLQNVTDWTEASINYPCGSTRDIRFVQTESGTGAAVNVGRIYYGKATNITQAGYIGPWTSWTPTGSLSTNTTYTGRQRIVGDSKEYEVKVAFSGTNTEGVLTINLPSGDVIDTAKISAGTDARTLNNSSAEIYDSGTDSYDGKVRYNSTTSVTPLVSRDDQGTSTAYIDFAQINTNTNVPLTIASGDYVVAKWLVPIVGLGSNTSVSVNSDAFFTDWTAFTPTSSWVSGVGSLVGKYRRVGDSMEVTAYVPVSGTPTSTTFNLSIPSGYTIDTAKVGSGSITNLESLGDALIFDASATTRYLAAVSLSDSTSIRLTTNAATSNVTQASPITFANGDTLEINFRVPIVGWTSPKAAVPILVGSVSSNSTGAERIERATLAAPSGGSCAITRQSGSWISGTPSSSGTGFCKITFATAFSAIPTCTCVGTVPNSCAVNDYTTTYFEYRTSDAAGAAINDLGQVLCMGPR